MKRTNMESDIGTWQKTEKQYQDWFHLEPSCINKTIIAYLVQILAKITKK